MTLQVSLICLLSLAASIALALPPQVEFRVIQLPRSAQLPDEHYVAIRTREAFDALWPSDSTAAIGGPIPKIDFKSYILLIAQTGVKPSSGYKVIFELVDTVPAPSNKLVTTVHVLETTPGNCPAFTELTNSVSYALIPQTTNEIRFAISRADGNCSGPPAPPFIK